MNKYVFSILFVLFMSISAVHGITFSSPIEKGISSVNQSDFWDDLNTPAGINTSELNNDAGFLSSESDPLFTAANDTIVRAGQFLCGVNKTAQNITINRSGIFGDCIVGGEGGGGGSSVWTQTGNNITYIGGSVGANVENPMGPFHVNDSIIIGNPGAFSGTVPDVGEYRIEVFNDFYSNNNPNWIRFVQDTGGADQEMTISRDRSSGGLTFGTSQSNPSFIFEGKVEFGGFAFVGDDRYPYSFERSTSTGYLEFQGSQSSGTVGYDFLNYGGDSLLKFGGNDEDVIIGGDGNVGIGTTSPTTKLEVDGDLRVVGDINYTGSLNAESPHFLNSGNSSIVIIPKYRKILWIDKYPNWTIQKITYDGEDYTKLEFWQGPCKTNEDTANMCLRINSKIEANKQRYKCLQTGYQWNQSGKSCYEIVKNSVTYAEAVTQVEKHEYEEYNTTCTKLNETLHEEKYNCTKERRTNNIYIAYKFRENCGWNEQDGYYCRETNPVIP